MAPARIPTPGSDSQAREEMIAPLFPIPSIPA